MGGEHDHRIVRNKLCRGSSPRGRGTRAIVSAGVTMQRFIPAWAGNTAAGAGPRSVPPVHPRVGGEHQMAQVQMMLDAGSSPRGRGTPRQARNAARFGRFIPAWAGNTARLTSLKRRNAVHPRVGGEHAVAAHFCHLSAGSSPRGRGTHGALDCGLWLRRFIPAWAGNTIVKISESRAVTVHPRVGGEHSRVVKALVQKDGSSPRGRGTPPW